MLAAYRGLSVILFAPLAAMLAVLFTDPTAIPTIFSGVFMEKMVVFLRLYFPVFLLGAIFGKVIELSGFSKSIVKAVIRLFGKERAIPAIVTVCAILTYGGVSLFVVVFAAYPFAAELFREARIPKRLIPGTIALGAFTFTMDALPGSPQIQNIIPTTFFRTDTWAAPTLGVAGGLFVLVIGLFYLESRKRMAVINGEGYGDGHSQEPLQLGKQRSTPAWVAILPLLMVVLVNKFLIAAINSIYGAVASASLPGLEHPVEVPTASVAAIWSIEGALLLGIAAVFVLAWKPVCESFREGLRAAVAGSLLAAVNTASEYGFGAVIAALPGFIAIKQGLTLIPNPLLNEAITVTTLSGVTGSASGGLSIALAAMAEHFVLAAQAAGIPLAVLHRVAAMASGGMDTLPHNGAVITLLAVTGLSHRESYRDIFALTVLKTLAVFFVIALYYFVGIV
jgi:H+/gluconate symporter-like permease